VSARNRHFQPTSPCRTPKSSASGQVSNSKVNGRDYDGEGKQALNPQSPIRNPQMSTKRKPDDELSGPELVKETARRIRLARTHWDAHRNGACRLERQRALALYDRLDEAQKEAIPQVLRVWLRYRSEKYFGEHRTPPGTGRKKGGRGR
jgi:hypothetical protein